MTELTIGRLANEAGVNVETIRYFQRRGLMPEPDKPVTGHRRYAADAAKRVHFIKRAQMLGFTLDEISGLFELDEARACAETRELASHKLEVIENKLADLKAMRLALRALLRQCGTGAVKDSCPIIHALAADWAQGFIPSQVAHAFERGASSGNVMKAEQAEHPP